MTDLIRATPPIVPGHFEALRRRHRDLDTRVDAEHRRVLPDGGRLQRLKRERLRLRDELRRYEALLQHPSTQQAA